MTKQLNELSQRDLLDTMEAITAVLRDRLIAEESAVTKYVEREIPSTIDEVETIEHEGKLLSKVDRDSKMGDFVKFFKNHYNTVAGRFYEVIDDSDHYLDEGGGSSLTTCGWTGVSAREIFEVVGAVPQKIIKSPNQQRAELIQRAREFVDANGGYDFHFEVKDNRTVFAWKVVEEGQGYGALTGLSTCEPSDVFNEDIYKAIALAKALEIDIPQEFMDAVQPDETVKGMKISIKGGYQFDLISKNPSNLYPSEKIIDDTNAEYEFVSVGD